MCLQYIQSHRTDTDSIMIKKTKYTRRVMLVGLQMAKIRLTLFDAQFLLECMVRV